MARNRTAGLALVLAPPALVWARALYRLSGAVERHAAYWAVPHGEPGGLLYVALGDSAAQGIGAGTPRHGYVALLADRLRAATPGPVRTVNLSRSGATLRELLEQQLPQLSRLRPDVVTVAVGGNDIADWDGRRFRAQLEELVAGLPAGSYVADLPYFMHGRWQRDAEQGVQHTAQVAARSHVHLVPLHEAQRAQGWRAMFTQFAADWFHPNDRGHRVWADAFWTEMQRHPALVSPRPRAAAQDALPAGS